MRVFSSNCLLGLLVLGLPSPGLGQGSGEGLQEAYRRNQTFLSCVNGWVLRMNEHCTVPSRDEPCFDFPGKHSVHGLGSMPVVHDQLQLLCPKNGV